MFLIGDKVAHPMHGAGVIDSIITEKIDGALREYYVFRMPANGLVLKIPTANAETIGIRPVGSRERIEAIFVMMPELSFEMDNNWNRRYRENLNHLRSGDLEKVVAVIKGLMCRDAQRGLSTGERKMLAMARQIFVSEISLVTEIDYRAAEQRLDTAIMQLQEKG